VTATAAPSAATTPPVAEPLSPGRAVRLVAHQVRYDALIFLRDRQSTFFTVALPVIFLVIFAGVFKNDTTTLSNGRRIDQAAYYVPQIIALGIVSAAFNNVVGTIIAQRETGVLKRRRATPVPAWVIVVSRALTALAISAVLVVVLLAVGRLFYGVRIEAGALPGIAVSSVVSALSLCAIAYALTTLVHSQEAATPVIQGITLPIFFISGVFFPEEIVPDWLLTVASIFPVRHIGHALLAAFEPGRPAAGIDAKAIGIVAAWGVAGLVIATRRFTWMPHGRR